MTSKSNGFNTLYAEVACPQCGRIASSGVGFRAGSVHQAKYQLGQKLDWNGPNLRPQERPAEGNLKTIGYFECDNPGCSTWHDCFPEVQEALITIENDVIIGAKVITYKPGEQSFDIISNS